jgi:hypothetical protein
MGALFTTYCRLGPKISGPGRKYNLGPLNFTLCMHVRKKEKTSVVSSIIIHIKITMYTSYLKNSP